MRATDLCTDVRTHRRIKASELKNFQYVQEFIPEYLSTKRNILLEQMLFCACKEQPISLVMWCGMGGREGWMDGVAWQLWTVADLCMHPGVKANRRQGHSKDT